jgi:hypothetical protein
MTNYLHWRKMTWALLAWSAASTAWLLIGGMRPIGVAVLWFAGMSGLVLLWLLTQPLFRQGRGLRGFFVRPGRGQWRVMNLHRAYWDMERGQKRRGHTRSV